MGRPAGVGADGRRVLLRFRPGSAQIPPQKRISLSLSSPLPGLRLSAEGYAAATAGTLQFGGSITAGYDIDIAAIHGSVYGDALIQLSPLYAEIRVGGKVGIEALGQELLSVGCHGTIVGPGPLVLSSPRPPPSCGRTSVALRISPFPTAAAPTSPPPT